MALCGCGRVGFDALDSDASTGAPFDASTDASAVAIAPIVHFPMNVEATGQLMKDQIRGIEAICETNKCPTLESGGPLGNCFNFDGIDDHFDVQSDSQIDDATIFTVAAWARLDSDTALYAALLSKPEGTGSGNTWELEYTNGQPTFTTSGDGLKAPAVVVGQWQHLAGSYDGTTKRLYVDGVLAGQSTENLKYSTLRVVLGADSNSNTLAAPFSGCLSDIRIYDQVLSASQVATLAELP